MNPFQKSLIIQLAKLQKARQEQGGYALVATVAMVVILSGLLVTAGIVGTLDSSSTKASEKSSKGFFAAEAGLNIRAQEIRERFVGYVRPFGDSPDTWEDCVDNSSSNDGSDHFACDTSLTINDQDIVTYVVDETGASPPTLPVTEGTYKGLNAQEYRYDVYSVALSNELDQQFPSSILGMRFKSRLVPLFQFAIFYEDDIEFQIPPDMTINGRIHSNNNIFVNSASSSFTLTLNSIITAGGTLYRGGKTNVGSQQCDGNVRIEDQNGNLQTLSCSGNAITPYQNDTAPYTSSPSDITTWDNVVSTGVDPLTIPTPEDFQPSAGGEYWDNADLRVVLELDNSGNPTGIEIQNQDGSRNSKTDDLLSCTAEEREIQTDASATDNQLTLKSSGFSRSGDEDVVLTIGDDLDSNVITSGFGSNTITLKRELGHSYQSSSTWAADTKVRKAVVSTSDTFYNYREKGKVPASGDGHVATPIRMLNVDVRALIDCAYSENLMGKPLNEDSNGGLVWYFTVDGPDSLVDKSTVPYSTSNSNADVTGNNYGVRLYNGAHLYSTDPAAVIPLGLTIVSDQAVYVRGDYNLYRDEGNTTTDFDADGDIDDNDKNTWIPASILADTINVLSNSWSMDDSYSREYVGNLPDSTSSGKVNYDIRVPTETTMNVAMLGGTDIAGGSNGVSSLTPTNSNLNSGGVNNYFRFHEDWGSSINFNYRGSFVSLSEPRRVNSWFCGSSNSSDCNIYRPPVRNWDYDNRFDDAANLPPMTPRAVFLSQELFERDFSYNSFKHNQELIAARSPFRDALSSNSKGSLLSPAFIF